MNNVKALYDLWLNNTEGKLYDELASICNNDAEILDRFYKNLTFGTGGLRGVLGAGTNRMNIYTVGQATQGLACYLNNNYKKSAVAIGYDSRINSDVFSRRAAEILAGNGIKVYIYPRLMPTPMVSYAVMQLNCQSGIVITASHNPSKYNGFKCFDERGYQMTDEAADETLNYIQSIDMFKDIVSVPFEKGLESGMIEYISEEFIESYYNLCLDKSINRDLIKTSDVKLIYSPLNGTGNIPVRTVLEKAGFKNLKIVSEQENPDGTFPTCPFPNPEIKQVFEIAVSMTSDYKADLILATDPDCDRVGVAVLNNGEYTLLNGNDMGVLLLNYILSNKKANGTLPQNPVVIKSFVSTKLADKVAAKYGCEMIDTLTGFKYIGEHIAAFNKNNEDNRFIMGFEESYGYLVGTHARDKDAVASSLLICEMTAFYKKQNLTLVDVLESIYKELGYYATPLYNFTFEGADGMTKMSQIMDYARSNCPKEIGGYKVLSFSDFGCNTITDMTTGEQKEIGLPLSNVLAFALENDNYTIVRPSGTEPKIKIYVTGTGNSKENAMETAEKIAADMKELLKI